jgi:hypothetical protein
MIVEVHHTMLDDGDEYYRIQLFDDNYEIIETKIDFESWDKNYETEKSFITKLANKHFPGIDVDFDESFAVSR